MGFQKICDKFFLNVQDQTNIEKQLVWCYMNMEGLFINPTTFLVSKEMFTHKLWISYGFETLELQSFAIKFLSQVIVTSTCERNWSTFEFIYT
jgi:hypothetical protein